MRFALVGSHSDGQAFAEALFATGRHQVVPVTGDLEESLADPTIDAVIVAGDPSVRMGQLRRALQSERHVVCVHPADETPDGAYEAALLQGDTGKVLLPLLPRSLHPALSRFTEVRADLRLLTLELHARGEVLDQVTHAGIKPSLPIWDLLRQVGGELAEVSAFTGSTGMIPGAVVLVSGRFEHGGLFQVTLIPNSLHEGLTMRMLGPSQTREFTWSDDGQAWHDLVLRFERAVAGEPVTPAWQDEVRALELDDAARRSVERQRVHLMEYQNATEEVGFKGLMTLVGCAMFWVVIGLLIASVWVPLIGWLILPLLLVFIGMQLFRYVLPSPPPPPSGDAET